jgi:uncharacterized protein
MSLCRAGRRIAVPLAALLLLLGTAASVFAQLRNLPPKPDRYIIDQAGVLDAGTLEAINTQLEQFERDTSNQFLVAIYPSLPPDAELYQYCTDVAKSWAPGQKGKDNGVVLFVFINDRKDYIAVGRGLEGALTDALTTNIRLDVIEPRFKQGDYAGGIEAGVKSIIGAAKGEFTGNDSTDNDRQGSGQQIPSWLSILIVIIFLIIFISSRGGGGFGGPFIYSSGGWGGGYGGGGGGGFGGGGGGGGGFSSGGGGFAGGGSGGSW